MCRQPPTEKGFKKYRKPIRHEQFLDKMDQIIPHAKRSGSLNRSIRSAQMAIYRYWAHIAYHFLQLIQPHGFGSGRGLYDTQAMRRFMGIDLGREPDLDKTTICSFRHLLERHNPGDRLLALFADYLAENGLKLSIRTIVDATVISTPNSIKNRERKPDREIHLTKKGGLVVLWHESAY